MISRIRTDLGLDAAEDTTEDKQFTFETVACVGACSIAPVLIVNKKVFGNMSPEKASQEIKKLNKGEGE
jgi:NADH:ubiquinone oxidoreductase subunit E